MSFHAHQIKTPENAITRLENLSAIDWWKNACISQINLSQSSIIHVVSRLFRRWIVSSRFFLEFETEILKFVGSHEIPIERTHGQQSA